ncbi:MAG: hypothetical protein IPO25_14925 [Saprospiraceae bacterium]|nr:hypothetical protein [Saprospiraceae bacterium]
MPNRLKLIHVVENLDKGAVENWIVNIFIESKKYDLIRNGHFTASWEKKAGWMKKVRVAGGENNLRSFVRLVKINF